MICHASAASFAAIVVVPTVLVFGNRSLPFDYVQVYSKPDIVRAGEKATIVFVVRDIRGSCDGDLSRWFTDAKGNQFYLGGMPTTYQNSLSQSGSFSFEKNWHVPWQAAPGPGVYESHVRFWCNPLQRLWPITHSVTAKLTVIP